MNKENPIYGLLGLYGSIIQSITYFSDTMSYYKQYKAALKNKKKQKQKQSAIVSDRKKVPMYVGKLILSVAYTCLAIHYYDHHSKISHKMHDIGYFLLCLYFSMSYFNLFEKTDKQDLIALIAFLIILTNVKIKSENYIRIGHIFVTIYYVLYIISEAKELVVNPLLHATAASLLIGHYSEKYV